MALTDRRAAVLGSPVAHSLSPVLHCAAYSALGLTGWTYQRIECDGDGLVRLVGSLGAEWAGLSVTMPGKRAALQLAAEATDRARLVGVANTLAPLGCGRWRADCTDIDGISGALRAAARFRAGGHGVVVGAGGTAAAAVVALAALGLATVSVVVRDPSKAEATVAAGRRAGVAVRVLRWQEVHFGQLASEADVLVNTVPPGAVAVVADALAAAGSVLDVIYHPWPTPLAEAVLRQGKPVATGLDMLLHQAFGQVEQFTGKPAPREAMREALRHATGNLLELPLADP
ncbi:MAG: shikimate dehydrogenase [Sciscionella sp.]